MEKSLIKTCIFRSAISVFIAIFIGVFFGVVIERIVPSTHSIHILSQWDIWKNNYFTVIKMIFFGTLSFGIYCVSFLISTGGIIGKSLLVIHRDYGICGLIYGFFPHAIVEMLGCCIGSMIPIFSWWIILEGFIKKNKCSKKTIILYAVTTILLCFSMMTALLYGASCLEYYISEMYWRTK